MRHRRQLHTIMLRNSHFIILTGCIVVVGILLRVLPSSFPLAKPFHLLELDLKDLRTEWRFILSGQAAAGSPSSQSPVALITMGETEFDQYGFPVNRGVIADVVATLKKRGAQVIAFDMTFESKQDERGIKRLAWASQQGRNVIYPLVMTDFNSVSPRNEDPIPAALKNHLPPPRGDSPIAEMEPVRLPEETLLSSAEALGHILAPIDLDGKIRRMPLVIPGRDGSFYLSLGLRAACRFHNIPKDGILIEWGKRIILDNRGDGEKRWRAEIPIDRQGYMRINYTRRLRSFQGRAFSVVDRERRKVPGLDKPEIPLDNYNGKVVLIGYLEDGSDQTATPLELKFPGVAVHATVVDNILQKKFVREAGWGFDALILTLFTGLMVILQVYPYRSSDRRPQGVYIRLTALALGILLGFVLLNFVVFCVAGLFLNLSLPLMSMALACFAAMGYRYVTNTERFIEKLKKVQALEAITGLALEIVEVSHRAKRMSGIPFPIRLRLHTRIVQHLHNHLVLPFPSDEAPLSTVVRNALKQALKDRCEDYTDPADLESIIHQIQEMPDGQEISIEVTNYLGTVTCYLLNPHPINVRNPYMLQSVLKCIIDNAFQ